MGRKVGSWYGPQAILFAMHACNKRAGIGGFKVMTCPDGNIFLSKIEKKIYRGNSVLVGLPLRLGLRGVSKEAQDSFKQVFFMPECVGVAGGEDHRSLFFTGIINDHLLKDPALIYLDPHYVQESFCTLSAGARATYTCKEVRILRLSKISESVLIGFYLRGPKEYESWKEKIVKMAKGMDSVFSVFQEEQIKENYGGQVDDFEFY